MTALATSPIEPTTTHLRLTPRTPTVREGSPRATDSQRKSAQDAPCHRPLSEAVGASTPNPEPQSQNPSPSLETLLSLYLDPLLTIADIAFTLGKSIDETITLTEDPKFLAMVDRYAEAHDQRATQLARCGRDTAARTFARLAETCDKPETARKAAGAILRMCEQETCATDRFPKRSVPSANPPPIPRQPTHRSAAAPPTPQAPPLPQASSRKPHAQPPEPPNFYFPARTPLPASQLRSRTGTATPGCPIPLHSSCFPDP